MMQYFIGVILFISASVAMAGSHEVEQSLLYVPEGTIIQENTRDILVKTPNGSIVEISFTRYGSLEFASGNDIHKDVLIPKSGITLQEAVANIKNAGKSISGNWIMARFASNGWCYWFKGNEENSKVNYLVDAESGELL